MSNQDTKSALILIYPTSEEDIQQVQQWKKKLRILNITYKKRILDLIKYDNASIERRSKVGN